MIRMGFGFDAHRLVAGRPLILGGVDIAYEFGLQGHSDADVLVHAICDALLGAAALGDLGRHFPDTDPHWKGVSSLKLLTQIVDMVRKAGFEMHNVDTTIVAQAPKLAKYVQSMTTNIASTLGLERNRVNIKATTTEGMGYSGRGEGIAAYAVATLQEQTTSKKEGGRDG